jgi:hypothetical protein
MRGALQQRDVNAREVKQVLQPLHLKDPAPKQSCHKVIKQAISSK